MKVALVLAVRDGCPHCERAMEDIPDLSKALQAFSKQVGLYVFSVTQLPRMSRVLPPSGKKGTLTFSKKVPPVGKKTEKLLEETPGFPTLYVFQGARNPFDGNMVFHYPGFQPEGADSDPESHFHANVDEETGLTTVSGFLTVNEESKPKKQKQQTRKKSGGSPPSEPSSSSSSASSSRKPSPKTITFLPRKKEKAFIRATDQAVEEITSKFGCRRDYQLLVDTLGPVTFFTPGYPYAGLILLREGCGYCDRAVEVNDRVADSLVEEWKQGLIFSIAAITLSRSPEDNAIADALKKGWGLDSFPSMLLLKQSRDRQVEIVACMEKDVNTSNPKVWEKFFLAMASPGQVHRRKHSGDDDLLGGVRRARSLGSWLQDDVTGLDPRSLAKHAPWDQYHALETFKYEEEEEPKGGAKEKSKEKPKKTKEKITDETTEK